MSLGIHDIDDSILRWILEGRLMDIEAEKSPPEFVYHYTNAAGLGGVPGVV